MAVSPGFGEFLPPEADQSNGWISRGFAELVTGKPIDDTKPVLAIISPTPGVQPGQPGGFPLDALQARFTPIVLTITDPEAFSLIALMAFFPDNDDEPDVITVFDGVLNAFQGRFQGGRSTVEVIANGFRFVVCPANGWPTTEDGAVRDISFRVRAVDSNGNLEGP